jgi:hypothetical protein
MSDLQRSSAMDPLESSETLARYEAAVIEYNKKIMKDLKTRVSELQVEAQDEVNDEASQQSGTTLQPK